MIDIREEIQYHSIYSVDARKRPRMYLLTLHIATMNWRCSPGFFDEIAEQYSHVRYSRDTLHAGFKSLKTVKMLCIYRTFSKKVIVSYEALYLNIFKISQNIS